ncbi:unnamed protein product [Adineta steineri]|uniref:G-protein coupled receptors family 1 profile domain-containing protein n=2 Tax=Adineta steineri TaxID=433720 RepID=A0A813Z010_9BILA|nr:unnamed protein product [Adineta steineri]CAF0901479.1 unnamed protein product [Adineta steineri]CAF3915465.1 unnamed protein product [Adineta steineri]
MSTASFTFISSQFSIYVGFSIFTLGIFGNLINLRLLFPSRKNPSSFLLFISSFFNLIALSFGLLPRILSIGFATDASLTNLIWCKSRLFFSYNGTITSIICICFASIDRFFVSCRSVVWRNRSNLKTAKLAILITIPIILGINIPYLLFYTIVQTKTDAGNITRKCTTTNSGLILYGNYFVRPVLIGLLPSTILCITGCLIYRNINSIASIQLRGTFQRNLTSMVFIQTITFIIPVMPFATINIYQLLTSSIQKSSYRLAQEMLVSDTSNIVLYISYAANFYVYLISSSSYRRDFLQFILFCYNQNRSNNHVHPLPGVQFTLNQMSTIQQFPRVTH